MDDAKLFARNDNELTGLLDMAALAVTGAWGGTSGENCMMSVDGNCSTIDIGINV